MAFNFFSVHDCSLQRFECNTHRGKPGWIGSEIATFRNMQPQKPTASEVVLKKLLWRISTLGLFTLFVSSFLVCGRGKPHYTFILPDGYVGWVQVIFNDPQASHLPIQKDEGRVIDVPESGITRTSDLLVRAAKAHDEFYYRSVVSSGASELHPMPSEYVLSGEGHGGWDVVDTGGRGPGYSWFIFFGPPEIRARVPWADITKVPGYGRPLKAPEVYPTPGRLKQPSGNSLIGGAPARCTAS